MISASRVRNVGESSQWRRGVDSYTYNQSTRRSIRVESAESRSRLLYPQPVDSATHSSRLGGAFESTRNCKDCKPWKIKKGVDSTKSMPKITHLLEDSNRFISWYNFNHCRLHIGYLWQTLLSLSRRQLSRALGLEHIYVLSHLCQSLSLTFVCIQFSTFRI